MSEAVSALPAVTSLVTGDLLTMVKVLDTTTAPAGAGGSNKRITAGNLAKYMVALGLNNRGAVAASTAYSPGDVVAYQGQHVLITAAVTSTSWSAWNSPPTLTGGTYTPIDGMDIWHASDWGVIGDAGSTDNGPLLNRALAAMWGAGKGGFLVLPYADIGSWIQVSSTVIIPPRCVLVGQGIESTYIKLASSSNVDAVQFMTYNSSSQATILSAATGATIAATSLENAFYAGMMHMCVDGHASAQAATSYFSSVNMTTNPTSSTATSDPDFDPSNILFNVEVGGASGDGLTHVGRGQLRVTNCLLRYNTGWGGDPSFDSLYVGCNFAENGIGGAYVAWASCNGSANKFFNNGTNAAWVSGTSYTARTAVMDAGAMYVCISAVSSATHPASDGTHWAHISGATAPAYWGSGLALDGVGENVWSACDAQQNSGSDYYLHNCTGARVDGISHQNNYNQATDAQNTSNPNNYASVVLDGSSGCLVDVVASTIHAGLVAPLKTINGATRNDVRMTGDSTVTSTLSADSTSLAGSGNSVAWNGLVTFGGSFRTPNIVTKTANYTVSAVTDYIILANAAGGSFTVTLPDATTCAGQAFAVKKTDSGGSTVHVVPGGVQTIDGLSTWPVYSAGEAVTVLSDGSNWQAISSIGSVQNLDVNGVLATNGLQCFGVALTEGTDTSGGAAASTPAFVSGTALQLNTTQDVMLYIEVKVATNITLAIGSTSSVTSAILTGVTAGIGVIALRVPKSWFVKISTTGTFTNFAYTQVTC